jgi:hypothetical protein
MIRLFKRKQPVIIRSCDVLTLSQFLRVNTTGDHTILLVSGKATPEQLADAWHDIITEYAELSNTDQYQAGMKLITEYAHLKNRYVMLVMAVKVLHYKYDKDCVEILQRAGYNYEFSETNPVARLKDLDLVSKKMKTIQVQLEQKTAELDHMNKDQQKADQNTWTDSIATISKFMAFRIDPNVVTVSEYVGYQRQLQKYNDQIIAKNATRRED